MSRLVWACLFVWMTACGSSDPIGSDPSGSSDEGDDGEAYVRTDAGADAAAPSRDAGRDAASTRDTSAPTPVDSGFAECADTRVDADKKPGSVNVVWVIDTSGSMRGEAAQVQQNLNGFSQQIVDAGLADYRVVVVSERSFVNVPDPLGSDATHFLHVEQRVGSQAPLQALLDRFADYHDFLIADALTHFVAVTDDNSNLSGQDWQAQMTSALGNDNFRLNAIASPPGESSVDLFGFSVGACTGPNGSASRAGDAYWQAAMATGGATFSICSGDWSMLLDELAMSVSESATVPCSLSLPASPQGQVLDYDTVNVVLGNSALPRVDGESACGSKAGWYYDDPAAPSGIQLCPSSCDAAVNGGSLQVALGCTTIVQ